MQEKVILSPMYSSVMLPTIIANLTATGCALLLLQRGPNRRLRLLTLTVGLMSLSQTANFLHSQGVWNGAGLRMDHLHQGLVACLSLLAIYLLAAEIYDRNHIDKKLRLTEFESWKKNNRDMATAVTDVHPPAWMAACQPSVHPSPAENRLAGAVLELRDTPPQAPPPTAPAGQATILHSDLRGDLLAMLHWITASHMGSVKPEVRDRR